MAAGAAFQLVLCAAVWAEGQIVGIEGLTLLAVLALFPPVAIAQNLPIGLGGLGVREGALVILLGALGTPGAQAIGGRVGARRSRLRRRIPSNQARPCRPRDTAA